MSLSSRCSAYCTVPKRLSNWTEHIVHMSLIDLYSGNLWKVRGLSFPFYFTSALEQSNAFSALLLHPSSSSYRKWNEVVWIGLRLIIHSCLEHLSNQTVPHLLESQRLFSTLWGVIILKLSEGSISMRLSLLNKWIVLFSSRTASPSSPLSSTIVQVNAKTWAPTQSQSTLWLACRVSTYGNPVLQQRAL